MKICASHRAKSQPEFILTTAFDQIFILEQENIELSTLKQNLGLPGRFACVADMAQVSCGCWVHDVTYIVLFSVYCNYFFLCIFA